MLTTTPAALLLVKAWEGFETQAYFDSAGVPTIGFGTTKYSNGDPVLPGDEITEDEAEAELFHYIRNDVEPTLNDHFGDAGLQPNQRDALASFLYNLGGDAGSWPTLKRLINDQAETAEIADQWMKYRKAGGKVLLGLYRRRMAEVLVWLGWPWEKATSAVQTASLETNWRDVAGYRNEPSADPELFTEDPALQIPHRGANEVKPITDPTPDTGLTTADLNEMQRESLETGRPIDYGVPMTSMSKKVPVESVQYLSDADKEPGNITVKRIEDSDRGKGYAKTQQGKQQIIVGAGGTAAVAIGAAEPVVKFVDKYSINTIAIVFLGLMAVGIVTYYWGQWQRERGEDNAEDLLG